MVTSVHFMRRYTVPQAARKARVSAKTIRRWLHKGILPDRRLPGTKRYLIHEEDLFPSIEKAA